MSVTEPTKGMNMADNIPSAWLSDDSSWEVEGYDFVDKKELVNVPLRIVALSFRTGKNGVEMVFCEAERVGASNVQFSDASTGIKAQISDMWMSKIGSAPVFTTEERWHAVSIVVRHGLRVSRYQREGSREWAETYYLRASGQRATEAPVPAEGASGVSSARRTK